MYSDYRQSVRQVEEVKCKVEAPKPVIQETYYVNNDQHEKRIIELERLVQTQSCDIKHLLSVIATMTGEIADIKEDCFQRHACALNMKPEVIVKEKIIVPEPEVIIKEKIVY